MEKLFYDFVTMITEVITGLDSNALKLWNLGEYLNVYEKVLDWTNVGCLIAVVLLAINLVDIGYKLGKHTNTEQAH